METEAVEQNEIPRAVGMHQLKGCAAVVRSTVAGGPVEITDGIEDQPGSGTIAVGQSLEVVENLLAAGGRHAEHRATILSTTIASRAVKVAGGIGDQFALGNVGIERRAELVNNVVGPAYLRLHQREHNTATIAAAFAAVGSVHRGTKNVAALIEEKIAGRIKAIS